MPTAFVEPVINKGMNWKEYLERCAYGFVRIDSANIDAPLPAEIAPIFTHSENDVELLLKEHADLQVLTHDQKIEKGRAVIRRRVDELEEYRETARTMNAKIDTVLAKVKAWNVPSEKHQELKSFAVSQLESSRLKFDGIDIELEHLRKYSSEDAFNDYCNNLRVRAEQMRKDREEMKSFSESATEWLRDLRHSLWGSDQLSV